MVSGKLRIDRQSRQIWLRAAEIRKALDDDANDPRYIETVVGQGYRFIGEVEGKS